MKFDIAFAFAMLASTAYAPIRGFISAEPTEGTAEEAEQVRTNLQISMLNLTYITLFTRDSTPMFPATDARALRAELTICQDLIKQCVMTTQIILYKD